MNEWRTRFVTLKTNVQRFVIVITRSREVTVESSNPDVGLTSLKLRLRDCRCNYRLPTFLHHALCSKTWSQVFCYIFADHSRSTPKANFQNPNQMQSLPWSCDFSAQKTVIARFCGAIQDDSDDGDFLAIYTTSGRTFLHTIVLH